MSQSIQNDRTPDSPRQLSTLVNLACLCLIIYFLRVAGEFVAPVVFAAFWAVLLFPVARRLSRAGINESVAVSLTLIGTVLFAVVVAGIVGSAVEGFDQALPVYQERLRELQHNILLSESGMSLHLDRLDDFWDPGSIVGLVGAVLGNLASILSSTTLLILTVSFMLFESMGFAGKMRLAHGEKLDFAKWIEVGVQVSRYFRLKSVVSAATGVATAGLLALVGVDFALLWGLLAFLLNYIPNIGSILAGIPPVFIALIQLGPGGALLALLIVLGTNMVIGNIVEPKIMGNQLGLSTLVVFLSLLFWGWLWGPIGMFLSVPLTIVVKVLAARSTELRWLTILLEDNDTVVAEFEARTDELPVEAEPTEDTPKGK